MSGHRYSLAGDTIRSWLGALLLGALAASCQCGPGGTGPNDSDGGSGDGGKSGGPGTCVPECSSTEFCSATNACLATGSCAANADCAEGTICSPSTHACVPGSSCGSTEVTGGVAEPNLIIALDRSCSMTEQVGTKTKWQIAVEAISALTVTYKGKVHFGLTLFPDTTGAHCSQDAIPIPVGPGKESAIQALLTASLASSDSNFPNGPCVTNIDTGIQQAATDPALTEVGRKSYVLLLTDGRQAGCNLAGGDTGTTKIIKDLNAQKGVLTFVIGFGAGVDPAQMNTFAEAGGVANNDPTTKYYKAEDQVSLEAALAKIGNRTLSCTYNLTQVPPDPSTLFVFFENTHQILRDATHHGGWDYEPSKNQVTFYGAECDQLRQGAVSDLDIVFGCPVPGIN